MLPWTDRAGRISPLKAIVFACLFVPAVQLAWRAGHDALGAKPLTEAIHVSGDWAIRFLLISLAISPLRRVANWPRLVLVRRMLGLAALGYLLLHFALYIADEQFKLAKVASEIILRSYLTIGFVALLGLVALGSTSFDQAIRALGAERWNRLHSLVYPIAILGVLHFAMQSKLDASEALWMSGLLLMLFLYRLLHRAGLPLSSLVLAATALLSAGLTALLEAGWYGFTRNIDPLKILPANLAFDLGTRPAWIVLAAGLAMALIPLLRTPVVRAWQELAGKLAPRQEKSTERGASAV